MTTQQDRAELIAWLNHSADQAEIYASTSRDAKRYRKAAALLAADARGGEAVAWGRRNRYDNAITDCISPAEHARVAGDYTIPLYTHHQPERVPLTDEQIIEGVQSIGIHTWGPRGEDFEAGVRYAEAAHHIGKPAPVGPLEDCHGVVAGKDQG